MPDIVITPNRGTTNNPKIDFTGTSAGTIKLEVLADGTIAWNGANGSLFSIADSLSGSLMSVNDVSGLPAFEVFSDNRVVVGQFGANLLLGTTTNSSNGRLQLATHTSVAGGIGFGTDIGLYRIAANKLAFRATADAEMSFRFNRTGGSYATTWENYIPVGSTDLRWFNGADKFTLTASGNATFSGYVVSTSGFAASGIYNYAFLQTTDSNNFWITPGNNQWGLYYETTAGGLLGGTGDSNRLGFVGNANARFYVDLNNGNGWFGGSVTASSFNGNATTATSAGYLTGGDSNFYAYLYNGNSGDLNTYNQPGLYSSEYTGSTNNPAGASNNGHWIQISDAGGTDVKTQWYYHNAGNDISMRLMWGNGTWRAWRKLLHDGNYHDYALGVDFPATTGANAYNLNNGTWNVGGSNSSWGNYKPGDDSSAGYAYNDAPGWAQYNVPSGYSTAYIGLLRWSDGGYFDVHAVMSDGSLVFRGRYLSKNAIENSDHSGNHDGQQIIKVSGLDGMTAVRITNQVGRLHLQGLGWTKEQDTAGTQVSETHWDLIYNKPAFTSSATTASATANTANTLVLRDGSGNFSAGTVTSTSISTTAGGSNGVRVHSNSGITASNNYMNFFTSQTNGWAFNANGTGADANTVATISASGNANINGIVGTSGGKLSLGILDINSGGTPSYIKINTTIPAGSTSSDFTVTIKGFYYNGARSMEIRVSWHYYLSQFWNACATSSGGWAPEIKLSEEGGFVKITLTSPGYWPKLFVESVYSSAYGSSYSSGWSWTDAAATNSPVTVTYVSDFGNSNYAFTSGLYATNFVDTNNSNYWCDPNGTSILRNIQIGSASGGGPGLISIWEAEDLSRTGGTINSDSSASSGQNWGTNTNTQVYGPYVNLPRGNYRLTARIKVADVSYTGNSVRMLIIGGSAISTQDRYIRGVDFAANNVWETFSIPFKVTGVTSGNVETYIFGLNTQQIYVDYVAIFLDTDSHTQQIWGNLYANGNVGIGTTTPSSSYKLDVIGNIGTSGYLNLNYSNLDGVTLPGNGSSISANIIGWNRSGGEGEMNFINAKGAGSNGGFRFSKWDGTTLTNQLSINSAGNVGIGLTNPDQPLAFPDVTGVKIQFNGINANGYQVGLSPAVNSGDHMMKFTAGETGAGEFGFYNTTNLRMLINKDGNVGIGTTSPGYKLEVIGDAKFGSGACNLYMVGAQTWRWIAGTTGYGVGNGFGLYHDTGGAYRLTVDTSGNIGIGTTSPSGKLDVAGDIIGVNEYSFRSDQYAINDWEYSGLTSNPTSNNQSDGSWYIDSGAGNSWNRGLLSKRRFRRVENLTIEYEAYLESNDGGAVHCMVGFVGGSSTTYDYSQTPANLLYHDNSTLRVYENGGHGGTDYSIDTRNAWYKFKIVLKAAGARYYIFYNNLWNLIKDTANNNSSYEYVRLHIALYRQRIYIRDMKVYVSKNHYRGTDYFHNFYAGTASFLSNTGMTCARDLYLVGGTGGNYANRLILGSNSTDQTLQDSNLRPTIYATGAYPVLTLNHTETSNTNHGPTIQFTFNNLTTGGSTGRQIVIGSTGNGSYLDIGFSGGGYGSNSNKNPHNGISGYEGLTPVRIFSTGMLVGSTGAYPNHITSTSYALDVRGNLDVSGNSVQNVGLVRFTNSYASGSVYYPTASFIQTRGNHSYGIVSEFRTNTSTDSDRPSILFYGAQAAHSWQVGQVTSGWGTNDYFGIGYRASNTPGSFSAWPSNYFTISTGGDVGINQTAPAYKLDVTGSVRITSALSVGNTTPSGTAGEIRATDNITAYYSDERLKVKLGLIEDPIEKIKKLSGFYFEANEEAIKLGYKKKREIGVSAQEVQSVLPEIIAPAPVDDKYMTVRYEKLIPLLIEAIKDQQKQIESLSEELKLLKNKL